MKKKTQKKIKKILKKRKNNMKIIYIIGKSSVGKDTIYKILKQKLNVSPYVLYTTRPIRNGEKNGIDYNFMTSEEMKKYIENNEKNVIECRTYQTMYGPWNYATFLDEQFNRKEDLLMEGTLEAYNAIKNYFKDKIDVNVIPVYIELEDGIRLERALKREKQQTNPKYEELCRRFLADSKDFSEDSIKKAGITKRFQNINLNDCVEEILEYIEKCQDEKTRKQEKIREKHR